MDGLPDLKWSLCSVMLFYTVAFPAWHNVILFSNQFGFLKIMETWLENKRTLRHADN